MKTCECGIKLRKRLFKEEIKEAFEELKSGNGAFFGDLDYSGSIMIHRQLMKHFGDDRYEIIRDRDTAEGSCSSCENEDHEAIFITLSE